MLRRNTCILLVILAIFSIILFKSFLKKNHNDNRNSPSKVLLNDDDSETNIISNNNNNLNDNFDAIYNTVNSNNKIINYLNDSDEHLLWFMQISDLHLSLFHDKTRIHDFEHFCSEILTLIRPRVVLASGDLTDAKTDDLLGSKQFEKEWKTYNRILNQNDLTKNLIWLDVRGNHDNFDVIDRDNGNFFRKYGMRKHEERSYKYDLEMPNGDRYTFIAVDACLEPGPRRPFNFFGQLTEVFNV